MHVVFFGPLFEGYLCLNFLFITSVGTEGCTLLSAYIGRQTDYNFVLICYSFCECIL